MKQQEILDVIGSNVGDGISKGHLDFSPFSAVQGQYGCLTRAGSGLLRCLAA